MGALGSPSRGGVIDLRPRCDTTRIARRTRKEKTYLSAQECHLCGALAVERERPAARAEAIKGVWDKVVSQKMHRQLAGGVVPGAGIQGSAETNRSLLNVLHGLPGRRGSQIDEYQRRGSAIQE
jgi:hypothetical protein